MDRQKRQDGGKKDGQADRKKGEKGRKLTLFFTLRGKN